MHRETAIQTWNLSKTYKLYDKPIDRIKESVNPFKRNYHRDFHALEDISLLIKKGDTVGIIGENGSGKSTLLKIITGVLTPTSGRVITQGRISALLELGAGFNPELTGVENIYFSGTIMGFHKKEIEAKLDSILSFADIGEFIHQPIKTYSSGMYVRLAFAVATNIDPEILIVDEALAVGDMAFQAKCMKKMKMLIDNGRTLLFVSHDISAVKGLCKFSIYLKQGRLMKVGESGEVCDTYIRNQIENTGAFSSMDTETGDRNETAAESSTHTTTAAPLEGLMKNFSDNVRSLRKGTGEVRVLYAAIYKDDREVSEVSFDDTVTLKIFYKATRNLDELTIAYYIRDKSQLEIIGSNSAYEGLSITEIKKGAVYCCTISFRNRLKAGNYSVTSILANNITTSVTYYDWIDNAVLFKSHDIPNRKRWVYWSPTFHLQNAVTDKNRQGEDF